MRFFSLVFVGLFFLQMNAQWTEQDVAVSRNNVDGFTPCTSGFAGVYPCSGYDMQSRLSNAELGGASGNDCWGWVDPTTGKEYALMCMNTGTTFVDISDPTNPIILGHLPTHSNNSIWRDVKVYQNYAFIVSEAGGHGMQVFDLTRLRNVVNPPESFTEDAHFNGFGSSHNIVINESSGFAYQVGGSIYAGGPQFINISTPLNPLAAGGYDGDGYTHDAQVVNYIGPDLDHQNKEIFFGANENTLTIVDVTDKTDPVLLARQGYDGVAYTHQGWLTEDHKYYLMDDEVDEVSQGINTRTLIWDVQDLDNPFYMGDYVSDIGVTDHNLYVRGDRAYQANYQGGLRVLDISDIANLSEIGYFDTYPENNFSGYDGAWSVYPYFPSGNILISTYERGLFVVHASAPSPSPVLVDVKLLLEGPYDANASLMRDNLREAGLISVNEPYSELGFVVEDVSLDVGVLAGSGNQAVVDWVLVELRDGSNPTSILGVQSALVRRDGTVISANGDNLLTFDNINANQVFVAVRHRNHFGVRTAASFNTSTTVTVDFSDSATALFGVNATFPLDGVNLLISGDANHDGQVNAADANSHWRVQNASVFDYHDSDADFNLDGVVNALDKNDHWRVNNSKVQQLD